jgi:hypothetical protein
VARFTLRYGTVSSFAVRVTDDHHTASRGMRRQERQVARNGNETLQQVNSVIVAIHQSSINYIFLVDERGGNDARVLLSGVDQAFFARGSLRVNRAPKSGLFSAHSWPS